MLFTERVTDIRNVILSEIQAPFLLVQLIERYQNKLDNKQEDPTTTRRSIRKSQAGRDQTAFCVDIYAPLFKYYR